MPKAVGIDLGTTNSVVAVLEAGEPTVIPNAEGGRTTPSVVGFSKSGEVLVGEVAKRQAITNPHRGGDDWDQRVIDWLVTSFKNDHGVDLAADKMALQRLKEAAEKAKVELSAVQETTVNLPFITATSDGPLHLDYKLTRSKFQELTAD